MSINWEKIKVYVDEYSNVPLPHEFQQIYRDWFYRMYQFQRGKNTVKLDFIQKWLNMGIKIVKGYIEGITENLVSDEELEKIKKKDWYLYETKRRENLKMKKEIVQLIGCTQQPISWLFSAAKDYKLIARGSELDQFIKQYNDICRYFAVENLEVPTKTPRRKTNS